MTFKFSLLYFVKLLNIILKTMYIENIAHVNYVKIFMKHLHSSDFTVEVNRVLNLDVFNNKFYEFMCYENLLK